ncbi:MAG: hypothetical protein KA339_09695, partial [Candidatus Kapabacteria bacterium]|nr:hypothetical protein [Candidatus Kapabacteria bacterium]
GRCRPILMIGAALRKNGSEKKESMTSFKLRGEEDRYLSQRRLMDQRCGTGTTMVGRIGFIAVDSVEQE